MAHILFGSIELLFALQATAATVAGTVRDRDTSEPLPGLIVAMTDLNRVTRTDYAGRYVFRDVSAGPHHIAVRFLGYAPRTLHALVPVHGMLEINLSLVPVETRLAAHVVRQWVPVREARADAARSTSDRRGSIAAVRDDPMLVEPDVLQTLSGGDVAVQPESPSGLHVRGGASDHVAFLLDGIPVYSPYHTAGLFSAWNPDAIASVALFASTPSPSDPGALAGTVSAVTRVPSARLQTKGSVSTTHARFTVDGPAGARGVGFLVSGRSGIPTLSAPRSDASFVRGGSNDVIAKLEAPAFGGRLRVLGYRSEDDVNTAVAVDEAALPVGVPPRNAFSWSGRSAGAVWTRPLRGTDVRALAWQSIGDAASSWALPGGAVAMSASRRDVGVLFGARRVSTRSTTEAGLRVERSRTSYQVDVHGDSAPRAALNSRMTLATAFAEHDRTLSDRVTMKAGGSLTVWQGKAYAGPRASLRWNASERVSLTGSVARLHQYAQSLRNSESMAGNVFPADIYIGAGSPGVPVARSDQAVAAVDYRPTNGVHVGVLAFGRRFEGMLLVAPSSEEPFATGATDVGSGAARGLAVDASVSAPRYGFVASYGLQRVKYASRGPGYVPAHGATHAVEGGVIVFPSPALSVRLGVSAMAGRRTSNVTGPLEWEACNLRDRGCEFGGSPRTTGAMPGSSKLPLYARADLGLRQHWHREVRGREAVVALYGAATNLFGRRNVLTFASDPATGAFTPIEMRPFAPLVVGMEWHF